MPTTNRFYWYTKREAYQLPGVIRASSYFLIGLNIEHTSLEPPWVSILIASFFQFCSCSRSLFLNDFLKDSLFFHPHPSCVDQFTITWSRARGAGSAAENSGRKEGCAEPVLLTALSPPLIGSLWSAPESKPDQSHMWPRRTQCTEPEANVLPSPPAPLTLPVVLTRVFCVSIVGRVWLW